MVTLLTALYILITNLWHWLPVFLFGVVVGGLGLWALWLNWPLRRRETDTFWFEQPKRIQRHNGRIVEIRERPDLVLPDE